LAADWPGNFFHGNGTGRLYLDARATKQQHAELEAIFSGKNGGTFQALFGGGTASSPPAQGNNVDIQWGETSSLTVGAVGNAKVKALQDGAGHPTRLSGAVAHAALQLDGMQVASAKGSRWADPDMRSWDGDSGTLHSFDWSA